MSADDIPAALLQVVRQISAEHFQGGDMFVAAAPESVPPRPAAAGQSDITTGDSVVYVRPPAGSVQDVDDQTIVALADKRTPDPVRFTTHPVPNTDPVRSVLGVLGRECIRTVTQSPSHE